MLKKLLLTTALSGLMLSSAMAQSSPSPSPGSSTPPAASSGSGDAMKSDATKADAPKADATKADASKSASPITSQSPNQMLVSNLKGVDVMGKDNEKIGDISDILVSKEGKVEAYLLSVGGFLGVGGKEVALNPSAVQLTQENNNWKAKVDMSKDQLAQAPDFKRQDDKTTTGSGSAGSGPASKPRSAPGGGAPGGGMSK